MFCKLDKINLFYQDIKNKFRAKFPKYFKYFDKNYFDENSHFRKIWNYNEIIYDNLKNYMLFFTNNIYKSMNRTLNSKFIGNAKHF